MTEATTRTFPGTDGEIPYSGEQTEVHHRTT